MRVYFPATLTMLTELNESGQFHPLGGTGFALTSALREAFTAGDDEELAEVAMRDAAKASLRLLAADDQHDSSDVSALPMRRVVVAADVDPVTSHPELDDAVVRFAGPVPRSAVASVHIDGADAQDDIRAAAAVIDAADLGDEDAELAVGDAEDHDLAWYATQELPFLLELL